MKNDERKNTIMMPAICTQCGGQVEVDAQREKAFCTYCGMQFIVEKAINTYNIQHAPFEHVDSINIQHAPLEHVDSINIIKTGAVESVLSFVKDQQTRYDGEIEKSNKFTKKYWWVYLLGLLFIFGSLLILVEVENRNEIFNKTSSSDLEGKNYKDVVIKLQKNGFINIKTKAMEDLLLGWLKKDGEVERVEINGDYIFSSVTKFPKDAEIIITYHTFSVTAKPTPTP